MRAIGRAAAIRQREDNNESNNGSGNGSGDASLYDDAFENWISTDAFRLNDVQVSIITITITITIDITIDITVLTMTHCVTIIITIVVNDNTIGELSYHGRRGWHW